MLVAVDAFVVATRPLEAANTDVNIHLILLHGLDAAQRWLERACSPLAHSIRTSPSADRLHTSHHTR